MRRLTVLVAVLIIAGALTTPTVTRSASHDPLHGKVAEKSATARLAAARSTLGRPASRWLDRLPLSDSRAENMPENIPGALSEAMRPATVRAALPVTRGAIPGTPAAPHVTRHPVAASTPTAGSSVWDRIAACESSGNWAINTGNGYFGGLQMDMNFWRSYATWHKDPATGKLVLDYARPDVAPKAAQIAAATWARDGDPVTHKGARGYTPWPVCGRRA